MSVKEWYQCFVYYFFYRLNLNWGLFSLFEIIYGMAFVKYYSRNVHLEYDYDCKWYKVICNDNGKLTMILANKFQIISCRLLPCYYIIEKFFLL